MILLSILIPAIPERIDNLKAIIKQYQSHIDKYSLSDKVQIISFIDNKKISIGEKRNALVLLAAGKYWVMTDDDGDCLTEDYFRCIHAAMLSDADVITYMQQASVNEDHSVVIFKLKNINEQLVHDGITQRPAWHCCTWRKEAVKEARFKSTNWGEDDFFQRGANELAQTSYHMDEICHIYRHDSNKTAAFQ